MTKERKLNVTEEKINTTYAYLVSTFKSKNEIYRVLKKLKEKNAKAKNTFD